MLQLSCNCEIKHYIYIYICLMLLIWIYSVTEALPWSTRVQIALDSARGLEYIHEHTVPVYIHRDIKCANILIDSNFRAKVIGVAFSSLQHNLKRACKINLLLQFCVV